MASFYESVFETAPHGLFVVNLTPEGEMIMATVNPVIEAWAGLTAAEICGKPPEVAFGAEIGARIRAKYQRCIDVGEAIAYEEYVPFQGRDSWSQTTLTPLRDASGRIYRLVGTAVNITEQKRAEQKLERQAEILTSILNNMSEGIIVADTSGNFLITNPAAEEMFGNTSMEVHPEGWSNHFGLFLPDQKTPFPLEELPLFRSLNGESVSHVEMFVRHDLAPDGRWVSINARPLRDAYGILQGGVIVCRDITGRKASELIQQQQTEKLRTAIQTLKRTQSQLVQNEKMSSLGQLVAGVAHEINNPVNFIYGNLIHIDEYAQDLSEVVMAYQEHYPQPTADLAELIEEKDVEFLLSDLPQMITSMKVGSQRIREIVDSLRTFSRLDEAECKDVDLHESLDSTLMILQHRIKAKPDRPAITITKTYEPLPPIECYSGQLNQVFMNVLANAIDALDEYYAQSEDSTWRGQVTIATRLREEGDRPMVEIAIGDNGPGIPKEIRSKIFDPFFTTKAIGKGTGLGMSISHQIITEKHQGIIKCQSSPDQGAKFIITIPVQQQPTVAQS
ncbi:MAG: PAS domain S-box protein [Spirulina sp. DLM2.Bin59]|nr:MAG: PAS domain S-box protein [Spirulina sp. DLM2.Bin59]